MKMLVSMIILYYAPYILGRTRSGQQCSDLLRSQPNICRYAVALYALMVSKLLFFLIWEPNLNRIHGMGNIVKERKARRLVAHAIPSLSYTVKAC